MSRGLGNLRFNLSVQGNNTAELSARWAESINAGATGTPVLRKAFNQPTLEIGDEKTSADRREIFLKFDLEEYGIGGFSSPPQTKRNLTINPGDHIDEAELWLFNSGSVNGGTVDIACLAPDGKWNVPPASTVEVKRSLARGETKFIRRTIHPDTKWVGNNSGLGVSIKAGAGTTLGFTGGELVTDQTLNLNNVYSDFALGDIPINASVFQTVKIGTSGNIDRVRFNMRRTGTISGGNGMRVRLWSADPTSFEPQFLVATSSAATYASIGATYGDIFFFFSPTIPTSSGDAFIVEVFNDSEIFDSSNYIQVRMDYATTSTDDDEKMGIANTTAGFGYGNYPMDNDLPFLYSGNSGTTIHTEPFGSIITRSYSSGATLGLNQFDITSILREWVNSPTYKENPERVVGIVVASADHFSANSVDQFVKDNTILAPQLRLNISRRRVLIT